MKIENVISKAEKSLYWIVNPCYYNWSDFVFQSFSFNFMQENVVISQCRFYIDIWIYIFSLYFNSPLEHEYPLWIDLNFLQKVFLLSILSCLLFQGTTYIFPLNICDIKRCHSQYNEVYLCFQHLVDVDRKQSKVTLRQEFEVSAIMGCMKCLNNNNNKNPQSYEIDIMF